MFKISKTEEVLLKIKKSQFLKEIRKIRKKLKEQSRSSLKELQNVPVPLFKKLHSFQHICIYKHFFFIYYFVTFIKFSGGFRNSVKFFTRITKENLNILISWKNTSLKKIDLNLFLKKKNEKNFPR